MIVIVDYGVGNLLSVRNMLRKAGAEAVVSGDAGQVLAADKLLLPGVGHFDYGMKMLNASGLREPLDRFAFEMRRPVLGICLGAQILGRGSEEGEAPGLGWIDMFCKRLPATPGLRVPHMGWNRINQRKPSPLLDNMGDDARFYFVHSFCMHCADPADVLATAEHGVEFTCAVQRGNIAGTQFHPEKSLRHGLAQMRAFVEHNIG
ncbi:MAG: Imidazole glycerol phosphate synthase subunit HisH 1 [Candidatus Accumulibacter regalis]|jgi:glutamine amidotransferase|uniref:Imidazole glycerol phosphate synthase subunit HisH n=1 Tax=Accumulibacter regalis TaxID=522306 RepID=A0A011QDK1_ACCRE|nr:MULTISPECIES: imidazole glycerol phosphate synthase subunit HisH [unclassified Candidatus Accumulibacter]EXI87377.1 MAG: Imidazole glycerol phosphate synthase subunit HisH 1 [Candidatus Accumulibacter regalis]MBL8368301.1 imidazole glycerol phosphate synthase subunit HisH [Accumulibacter sp.]HRE72436.1 imidazole glycerol phosphate synthase subunit HisH [Accumulibacter sp.]